MLTLMGRVPVKVTTENGPIHLGDLLTISSKPGYAMRCAPARGCVIIRQSAVRAGKRGRIDTGVGDVTIGIVQLCKLTEDLSQQAGQIR